MTTAFPGLPHLLDLIRSPRGGLAILAALLLSTALVIQAGAATLQITTATLPDGEFGTTYNQTLAATGGTPSYEWTVVEGALPSPLGLNPSTGQITGAPSELTNAAFTVRVKDADGNTATKSFAIKVNPQLTITTSSLASGVQNVAYIGQQLASTGGAGGNVWALVNPGTDPLPTGLLLSPGGLISGTLGATAATETFAVKVTDSLGFTDSKSLTITVTPANTLTIVTAPTLPNGISGVAGYSAIVKAAGGIGTYTWTGAPPFGLTLTSSPTDATITGTPTGTGTTSFVLTVNDTDAGTPTVTKEMSITVNTPLAISTTNADLAGACPACPTAGASYARVLTATGGTAPYTWTIASGLPADLTLFGAAGVISGVPMAAGTYPFTAQVTDVNGVTIGKALSITVAAAVAPTITTTSLPNAIIGSSYTYQLQRSGGVASFEWAVTPALPAGLVLDTVTGQITGTPSGPVAAAATFNFTVASSGGAGTSPSKPISIAVVGAGVLNITTTTLPNATINVAYPTQTLLRTGGVAPFNWTLASSSALLPNGLTLNSNGTITGTPTVLGAVTFNVRLTDSTPTTPLTTTKSLTITVVAASTPGTTGTGTGSYYGPCKAFYKSASAEANSNASAFKRLLDAAGVTAQVQAFCDVNGQPESEEDQEFRRLCTSFFSGSNGWRSGGSKVSGLRRLIEAAGSADALRSFCTTRFGAFTGQECDDDDLHGTIRISNSSRDNGNGNGNGNKKGKH